MKDALEFYREEPMKLEELLAKTNQRFGIENDDTFALKYGETVYLNSDHHIMENIYSPYEHIPSSEIWLGSMDILL